MTVTAVAVTPRGMTAGMAIVVSDFSDPLGMRKITRVVSAVYPADFGDTAARWVIEFDDSREGLDGGAGYVYPVQVVTSGEFEYGVVAGYVHPDYSALKLSYVLRAGGGTSNPHNAGHDVVRVTMFNTAGDVVAVLEPRTEPGHTPVWGVAEFETPPAEWLAEQWTDRDAAVRWVWARANA